MKTIFNTLKSVNKFGLVAILFAASLMAFTPAKVKANKDVTTYYAVQTTDANHWDWQTTQPDNLDCSSGNATCAISSATTPPSNSFPSSYTVVSGSDKHSVYR